MLNMQHIFSCFKTYENMFLDLIWEYTILCVLKNNQRNQGYSGNQKNVIQGQRPDIENRHTLQRT